MLLFHGYIVYKECLDLSLSFYFGAVCPGFASVEKPGYIEKLVINIKKINE